MTSNTVLSEELKRYDRQILLPELGLRGQIRLKNTSVLIIGAGGLGCPVVLYLAAAGLGRIGIIDHDVIDESNLQRQILYDMSDLGKNKAITAATKASLLNPNVAIYPYPFKLDQANAGPLIEKYDIIVDGSDNFSTKYLVNDSCVLFQKPLVFGSILRFEGQISVFNHNGGPDYRSLYPDQPIGTEVPSCGESGVIGTLPGIIGSYMANEVIKLAGGFGSLLSGRLMTIDVLNNQTRLFDLSGISPRGETSNRAQKPIPGTVNQSEVNEITVPEFENWLKDKQDFVLVDVREPYEFEEGNMGGLNIPVYQLVDRIDEIPPSKKLVFYCTSNYRSRIAIKLAQSKRKELLFLIKF